MTADRLLVVCTANLVRSPVAEAAFEAWIDRSEVSGLQVASAGVAAVEGVAVPASLIRAVRPYFLDLHAHRSRPVRRDEVRDSSLVLGLAEAHREALQALVPAATPRIFTLAEFARLVEATPTLSELDGDFAAFVRAVHRERPRQPRPRLPEDVEDAFGGSERQYDRCVRQVVDLVDRVTARFG
jgi:protein-tyrosine phosphatase